MRKDPTSPGDRRRDWTAGDEGDLTGGIGGIQTIQFDGKETTGSAPSDLESLLEGCATTSAGWSRRTAEKRSRSGSAPRVSPGVRAQSSREFRVREASRQSQRFTKIFDGPDPQLSAVRGSTHRTATARPLHGSEKSVGADPPCRGHRTWTPSSLLQSRKGGRIHGKCWLECSNDFRSAPIFAISRS